MPHTRRKYEGPKLTDGQWYYALDGERLGPFDRHAMREKLHAGVIGEETLVWSAQSGTWIPLEDTDLNQPDADPEPSTATEPPGAESPDAAADSQHGQAASTASSSDNPTAAARHAVAPPPIPQSARAAEPVTDRPPTPEHRTSETTAPAARPKQSFGKAKVLAALGGVALLAVFAVAHFWPSNPTTPARTVSAPQSTGSALQNISSGPAAWALSVVSGGWRDGSGYRQALQSAAPLDGRLAIGPTTSIVTTTPSYLKDMELVVVHDPAWNAGPLALFFLADSNGMYRLDGRSPLIGTLADRVDLSISNVDDYLWFFNFFTRSEFGPFLLVQSAQDKFAPRVPGNSKMDQASAHYAPIQCRLQRNVYSCSAAVYYGNGVFSATYRIERNGSVAMQDDTPRVVDLPVQPYYPLSVSDLRP